MEASPATTESTLTFFAEQDLLCALSTCPGGDLSAWGWSQADESGAEKGRDMRSTCRSIKVEVLELKDQGALEGWKRPERSAYKGYHGMKIPGGEA